MKCNKNVMRAMMALAAVFAVKAVDSGSGTVTFSGAMSRCDLFEPKR